MTDESTYTPSKVWKWNAENGGKFANINRPIAGPTHDKELAIGKHPLQLYSLATPNGVKVTVMLEELLALGNKGAEYDAHLIRITEGEQFGSGFVSANPNSKIPALVDHSTEKPTRVFESGAASRSSGSHRMLVMVVLADGQCTLYRWWVWAFLCLCTI